MIPTIYYLEDNNFYFVWKPAGIATSFGEQYSFSDEIVAQKPAFFLALQEQFDKQQEYGLLNRLDNDTQGFIYFAKTPAIKQQYEQWQDGKQLVKHYMCDVVGRVDVVKTAEKIANIKMISELPTIKIYNLLEALENKYSNFDGGIGFLEADYQSVAAEKQYVDYNSHEILSIQIPIMHSASSADRMIAISSDKDRVLGRGKPHMVTTILQPISYDTEKNTTHCYVYIQQGIRHQIRVHLAKIGYPILGDVLYRGGKADFLHLWSVGFGYPEE